MRGTDVHVATLMSTNSAELAFPYNGGSKLGIIIRKGQPGAGSGIEAMVGISKGQLKCSYDGCLIAVKLDDGAVQRWSMSEAEGLATSTIFFNSPAEFLAKLRKSKTAIVEVTVPEGARYQFDFDVPSIDGWEVLKPPPPPKPGTPPPPISGYCFESGGNTSCARNLDDCRTYLEAKNITDAACKHVNKVPCAFEPGDPYCDANG